jgi:hypothetical protein
MAPVQYYVATRSRNRKWFKVGITSFSFIAAVVGAFYLGSRHDVSPIGNAPQSAVTNAAPSSSTQVAGALSTPVRSVYARPAPESEALTPSAVRELIEQDGTDTNTRDETIIPATYNLGLTGPKVTSDRYAAVLDELSGPTEGMDDLTYQISDAVTNISVNHLSPAEIIDQENVIAAMKLFAMAKNLAGEHTSSTDAEILRFVHDRSTRADVQQAIAQAHQALLDAA